MLFSPWFAVAGLIAAAGPFLIHLLNRRRFRVVHWAAMDFLLQAARRSRRILQLRDLLLLLLRTACVLLFGLAMARPYVKYANAFLSPDQPIHAVIVVDNSLSMSYEQAGKPLLDEAKAVAKNFIERVPGGSRISVLPLCGSAKDVSLTGYSTKEDALEALQAIEPVDRGASASAAVDLAAEACKRVESPQAKQIMFLSDQQAVNWPPGSLQMQLKALPSPLQVVQVAAGETENAWISDFRLLDDIGDMSTPAVFLATVRYQGTAPRHGVQVTLKVQDAAVATQTVDLEPGQEREVRFPPYQFDVSAEPDRPAFVNAEVSIPHDRLPADDQRCLAVPVVSALPVVFVDQYGEDENPARNQFGETIRLRRLLAPVTAEAGGQRQLVQVRHVRIERLERDLLADARLVVIAGVQNPGTTVPLLREYVEQGGSVVIGAGGDFDPEAWTDAAWEDGRGILPAPLKPVPIGQLPGAGGTVQPFQLDLSSLVDPTFVIEHASRDELDDLYKAPYFFKAVEADVSDPVMDHLLRATREKIEKDRAAVKDLDEKLAALSDKEARQTITPAERKQREALLQARTEQRPQWLAWADARAADGDAKAAPAELAQRTRPNVLGTYTNRVPFMIERNIGRGRTVFISTGVYRDWNTLTSTNAVVIFDRLLRDLLMRSLAERNLASTGRLVVPVSSENRRAQFTLTGPNNHKDPVSVDALGADRYGIILENLPQRGIYRLSASTTRETSGSTENVKLWEVPVAVNGPAEESDLRVLDAAGIDERMAGADYRFVAPGSAIDLAGVQIYGQDYWKWLMMAVVAALLLELAVLAWPNAVRGKAT